MINNPMRWMEIENIWSYHHFIDAPLFWNPPLYVCHRLPKHSNSASTKEMLASRQEKHDEGIYSNPFWN